MTRPASTRPQRAALAALVTAALSAAALSTATPAQAQAPAGDDLPPPPVILEVVPARFSWDVAVMPGFGMLPQFPESPPWMGLGARVAWGRHFKSTRIGPALGVFFEGPIGVQWSNVFEPQLMVDFVAKEKAKGMWFGVSVGPSLMIDAEVRQFQQPAIAFTWAPMISLRLGWSQPVSAIARRFFVAVEPRFRLVDGQFPSGGVALVFGSGRGY
jgi:hypothetical protein